MILLAALVAGGTALFILSPLLGWGASEAFEPAPAATAASADRLARRQEVLAAIKDLDMEFEVGKLGREDYEQVREQLSREAIEIYRDMDRDGNT